MNDGSVRIAITSEFKHGMEPASSPVLHAEWLARVGAASVILPCEPETAEIFQNGHFDGLILTGGGDVSPHLYGGRQELATRVDDLRDRIEFEIVKSAYRSRIPILAVCRGMQVVNVAFGGSLIEDLPTHMDSNYSIWHQQKLELAKPADAYTHDVTIDRASFLFDILGTTSIQTNTMHHQAVRQVAPLFRAVGHASDGVVEAIEISDEDYPFFVGLQWHPETLPQEDAHSFNIHSQFVETCKQSRQEIASFQAS